MFVIFSQNTELFKGWLPLEERTMVAVHMTVSPLFEGIASKVIDVGSGPPLVEREKVEKNVCHFLILNIYSSHCSLFRSDCFFQREAA